MIFLIHMMAMILEQHLINHLNQKNHSSDNFFLQKLEHHTAKHPTFFRMIPQ